MSPRSLRGQLVLWLLPLHLLASALIGGEFYMNYHVNVNGFMDGQMRALAQSYATRSCAELRAPPPLTHNEVHEDGNFIIQLWCEGRPLSVNSASPALQVQEGWSEQADWRVYTVPASPGSTAPAVQVLQSLPFRNKEVGGRAMFASFSGLLLLPLVLGVMVLVIGRASRRLRDSARQLAGHDEHSDAQLAPSLPSEVTPLVQSFESLLSRLRESLGAQRRFVQDAAHELRTPLTALGLQLENLRPQLERQAGNEFAQLQQGMRRASHLVEQMLCLSRQDAGAGAPPQRLDLRELLRASVAQVLPLADRLGVEIVWSDGIPGELSLQGREAELRSLFDNLLDNALRHSPRGAEVELCLAQDGSGARWVDISDQGPGLPAAMRERVFDRFFRLPDAPPGGSGLGLAIARQAAQRHGLGIELRDREDGRGGLVARVALEGDVDRGRRTAV
jgi:signal transduction histidine kinase